MNNINVIVYDHLYSSKPLQFEEKADGSIITNVDKQISKDLEKYFRSLHEDVAVISEENADRNYDAEHIYVIDPLDGTENFVSGLPIYGTSIAHYAKNEHVYSSLDFPALNKKITSKSVIRKPKFNSRIVSLSSYLNIDEIKSAAQKNEFEEYRMIGCAIYNIYCVIHGKFKSYSNPRVNSWDILAGINIAIKNGINVRINGEKYNGEFLKADQKYSLSVFR